MDAFGQQQGGGGVPPVVQPHVADAGRLQQIAPGVVVGLLVDGPHLAGLLDVQGPRTGPFGVVVVHGDLLMFAGVYQERADFPADW